MVLVCPSSDGFAVATRRRSTQACQRVVRVLGLDCGVHGNGRRQLVAMGTGSDGMCVFPHLIGRVIDRFGDCMWERASSDVADMEGSQLAL